MGSGAAAGLGRQHGQRRPDRLPAHAVAGERLTVGVDPAQVIGGDPAHLLALEAVDRSPQSRDDEGSGSGEDGGWLDGVLTLVGSAKLIHVVARRVV